MSLSFNHLSLLQAMFLAIFYHIDGVPTFLVSFVITKADLFCFWGIFFFFSNRTFPNCHRMCNGSPLRTFLFQKLRKAIYLIRIRLSKLLALWVSFWQSTFQVERRVRGRMNKSWKAEEYIILGPHSHRTECVGRVHGSEEWKWLSLPSFWAPNTRLQNWNLVCLSAKTMPLKGFGIRKCYYHIYIAFPLELKPLCLLLSHLMYLWL